jgi:hypothetical protein
MHQLGHQPLRLPGRRALPPLIAALVVMLASLAAAVPAFAAPDTYCYDGATTEIPPSPSITASSTTGGSNTAFLTIGIAETVLGNGWSVFYFGYTGSVWGFAGSPAGLEVGYATHTLARGACTTAVGSTPAVTHVGVCKLLRRGDGTTGMFQEITVADWNDPTGPYVDAPAANWVDGLGLTCDDPVALGYTSAGTKVSWGGKPAPNNDPKGVRGAGLNDVYPLFRK